jgi:PilZ domain
MARSAVAHAENHDEYERDQARLVQAWRHEFLHVAMMSAFVTMGCNAIANHDKLSGLSLLENNLPAEPAIDRAIHHGLLAISSRYNPAFFAAQEAYLKCTEAIAIFKEIRCLSMQDSDVLANDTSLEQLRAAWQETSRACLVALQVFDHNGLVRQSPSATTSLDNQCPMRLMQLLRAASAGETLASSGLELSRGQLPSWVQRRRWDRHNVAIACTIETRGSQLNARIRNISLGGALLESVSVLPRGARLKISAADGWMFHACVIWWRDRSAGIKFDEQLSHTHPLIRAVEN